MNKNDIIHALTREFKDRITSAPKDDARRTSECLQFSQIDLAVRDPNHPFVRKRRSHTDQCAWCRSAIATTRLLQQEEIERAAATRPVPVAAPATPSGSLPDGRLSPAVAAFLSDWIRKKVAESPDEASSARFDSDGTLHIRMSDYPSDGRICVRLVIDSQPFYLGDTEVTEGRLRFSRPMPELGLQDLPLPGALLSLEALPDTV